MCNIMADRAAQHTICKWQHNATIYLFVPENLGNRLKCMYIVYYIVKFGTVWE